MEQRNLLLAIALSLTILIGFQFIFPPAVPPQQPQDQQTAQTDGSTPGASVPGVGVAPTLGGVPTAPSREEVMGISPRVSIETPRLRGSIALRGARIDDLILTDYRETLAADSPAVTLLSPEGSEKAYFSRFGWAPKPGSDLTLPYANTLWTAEGGPLTQTPPVTLSWDNGDGLSF